MFSCVCGSREKQSWTFLQESSVTQQNNNKTIKKKTCLWRHWRCCAGVGFCFPRLLGANCSLFLISAADVQSREAQSGIIAETNKLEILLMGTKPQGGNVVFPTLQNNSLFPCCCCCCRKQSRNPSASIRAAAEKAAADDGVVVVVVVRE